MICFGKWRIVSLTPALSCIRASGDGHDRITLYAAFTAASVLLSHIKKEVMELVNKPPPEIKGCRFLPCRSSLLRPNSQERIKFKILNHFPQREQDRLLFIAETIDGEEILVKFTRRYSPELHKFCEGKGHAPALLGFESLAGGFFGVAMEYIKNGLGIHLSQRVEKHKEWAKQLKNLVDAFHTENLVHGDLRCPNIICDENRVMLIDFDWGGKLGEVSYPSGQLNPDLIGGRDTSDLYISKEDDRRVLDGTLLKSVGYDILYGPTD